jgi:hypothetical protein
MGAPQGGDVSRARRPLGEIRADPDLVIREQITFRFLVI